ncbi:MAG TPA: hypothetical protein VIS06_11530 [Mycobacteriales bacterium]
MTATADTVLFTGTDTTTPVSYTAKEFRLGAGAWLARKDAVSGLVARSGVLSSDSLAVAQTPTASMSVVASAGIGSVQGTSGGDQGVYTAVFVADSTLTLGASDPGAGRLDLVQLRVYDIDDGTVVAGGPHYGAEITIKPGTPSGTPVLPTPDADAIPLARVSVAAGVSSVTDADITDLRARTVALGGVLPCTSTTRPAHQAGLVVYETDTGLVQVSDGATWKRLRPDGPAGVLTRYSAGGSNTANSTTPVTIAGGAFTAPPGTRIVELNAQCSVQSTVATDLGRVTLLVDGGEVARYQLVPGAAGTAGTTFGSAWGSASVAAGAHTWSATVLRVTGSGTVTGGLSALAVTDIGAG